MLRVCEKLSLNFHVTCNIISNVMVFINFLMSSFFSDLICERSQDKITKYCVTNLSRQKKPRL